MQNRRVKFFAAALIFVSVIFFAGCKKSADDSIGTKEIEAEISNFMENYHEMEDASPEYLSEVFGIDASNVTEYVSKRSLDTHIDQFGIFKLNDEKSADSLQKTISENIKNLKKEWDGRYFSEENKKLASAKSEVFGKYVVFTVLDTDETESVIKKIREILY